MTKNHVNPIILTLFLPTLLFETHSKLRKPNAFVFRGIEKKHSEGLNEYGNMLVFFNFL